METAARSARDGYAPIYQTTRGGIRESLHYGAAAISDRTGKVIAWIGDPQTITFPRSSAKPFQALPFVEGGGLAAYGLDLEDLALICASHSGTERHVAVAERIQQKTGVSEEQLQCGAHEPYDLDARLRMLAEGQTATSNHNNCSGKHSGMLAGAQMHGWPMENYLDPGHPLQQQILAAFAAMCAIEPAEVIVGIDGCSAPTFGASLAAAATAYARLCDPDGLADSRAAACRTIVQAITGFPEMVGGPGRFDTRLMQASAGRLVSKGGAEAFQAIGLLPEALGAGSPALGITVKVSDGDASARALRAVVLEILIRLGALSNAEAELLADLGPQSALRNVRGLVVGEGRPCFELVRAAD